MKYTIELSTRDAPNPLHGAKCFAGRCDQVATRVTFGGSAAYCDDHARGSGEPIPATRPVHVVTVEGGGEHEGWTLADALANFSASIEETERSTPAP